MDNNEVIIDDGVTVREFSRQIGKSHVWVLKLVKQGILPRNADGTIPLDKGLKAFADYLTAEKNPRGRPKGDNKPSEEKITKQRGRPRKVVPPDQAATGEKRKPGRPRKEKIEEPDSNLVEDIPNINDNISSTAKEEAEKVLNRKDDVVNINSALNKAKLAEKTYQARLRELEYKLKSGELVEKTTVATEAEWLATQIKSKLMAIPPRISTLCEGRLSRDIEEILTDALNDAMKELQKCKYAGEKQ